MENSFSPLATSKGEVIYSDKVVTTYALHDLAPEIGEHIKVNMLTWSRFMSKQFNPSTFDEAAKAYIDTDYIWYGMNVHKGASTDTGREAGVNFANNVSKGITNFHITNRMFGVGDRVANYWHMTGIHSGTFLGQPATQKPIDLRGLAISTFRNGKLIEEWEYNDDIQLSPEITQKYPLNKNIQQWDNTVSEKINYGHYDLIDSMYADTYLYHGAGEYTPSPCPIAPSISPHETMKEAISALRAGFSDLRITNDIFGAGDRAANHFTMEGTHDGTWRGLAPTNKKVKFTGIAVSRFVDGKITEEWEFIDELSLLRQLGLIDQKYDFWTLLLNQQKESLKHER